MSGSKTIVNSSSVTISVVLRGRVGADPSSGSLPPVTASIPAGGSASLTYGDSSHPYLNSLSAEVHSGSADIVQTYSCLERGGPGTLDNMFNAHSVLTLGFDASTYGFTLAASN